MELRGRRVLITGASRGIGESLTHAFAGVGATVALVARNKDAIEAIAGELCGTAHATDLADPAQVTDLIARVEEGQCGRPPREGGPRNCQGCPEGPTARATSQAGSVVPSAR